MHSAVQNTTEPTTWRLATSAQWIIDWHENSWRLFVTLFAMDKCSYSHREERASHPFAARGICGNKLLVESSDQTIVQGQRGCPLQVGSEMWKIVAYMEKLGSREHPDAEYKYRGVFVVIIEDQAQRRDLNNIYTLNTFITYLYTLLYCLPRRILHTFKRTSLVYSLVFRILLSP